MIIDENNEVLAEDLPLNRALQLIELLCEYAPEVRDYTIAHCYFEKR